ncbi:MULTISPECIES: hypothetical protein [unclassified Modestobacter]|uniref:hypothetical protein n=1 Tax=unclassified Modestobacter TaxID=2643866 RepID=UPI0022AA99B9|nr:MULTISPECIES: hypothetical protein [unclassified Modestobacter]MCZ2826076.1 hypothetical protein [Modestobacter sp. VKM Ac-2981]MCZ2852859.1 hypothetical protein [Modestobacter sp. VKM Ac-2982]
MTAGRRAGAAVTGQRSKTTGAREAGSEIPSGGPDLAAQAPAGLRLLLGGVVVASLVIVAVMLGGSLSQMTPTADVENEQGSRAADGVGGHEGSTPGLPSPDGGIDGVAPVPGEVSALETANGDLGLEVPISSPACDGTWIVFLGAAIDAATYESDISRLLAGQPDAKYLLTEGGCSSMRQRLPDGSLIYSAYIGPYPDQAAACAARAAVGGGAYVKRMDNVTSAEQLWEC